MKTAEKWGDYLAMLGSGNFTTEHIEQIQLDAMKEGMRRAANVCCDQQKYFTREASVQCLQNHDAILTAAEQLTVKDLV